MTTQQLVDQVEEHEAAPAAERHDVPLRRNWRYQAMWSGAAASMLGTMVADTAYPLLLLAMTGSPLLAGAFGAVQFTASLLFGLHGGALADRRDRRVILIAADAVRVLATLSVPAALWLDCFTVWHALLVAALIGATTAYAGPVRTLAVRSLVPGHQLRQALTQDEVRVNGAVLLGPPLAGLLLGLGRAVPFLATALASLYSLATACLVRFDGRPAAAAGDGEKNEARENGGALEGLRQLWGNPVMRAIVGVVGVINLIGAATLLPLMVLLRDGGTSTTGTGLVLAGEAVGGLLGALLVRPLHRHLRPGRLLLAVAWAVVPLLLTPALVSGPVALFLMLLVVSLGVPALRVMVDLLIFQQVPDALRGRVIAATMTLFMLGVPLGSFASGLLLDHLRPVVVLQLLTALLAVALLPATFNRPLRQALWPAQATATAQ
ncbi:MFS family permease [Kitasatospora gansuensis]|uniref:MFS family permease n=1 Tax=Kitasatospora gansuensis TaxID=258050 RepID=A0A7W7WI52_9ACTN|nr:MFS transporter [Kitasatospora gansuensis]MBB4948447.1 MFS family permease [Kitasatospora gansuensis]